MKGRTAFQVRWLVPAAAVLLATALSTHAQSGRIIPKPTPTPEAERPPKVEEPKFVPDPNAEKYKLVFTTRFQGSFSYRSEDEALLARRAALDNFAEHLNQAGAQGYRVISSLKADPAIVTLDQQQFEYAWTETHSREAYFMPGFAGTYAQLAKKGFRLAAHSLLYSYCEPLDNERCYYGDFFLFERRKGKEEPREYAYARSERGGTRNDDSLTAEVRSKLAEKFYPAHLLSKIEILLEREPTEPALAEPGTEVRVVRSNTFSGRDELPKKVNELARQGFRLALADYEIALMYRRPGAAEQLSYVWLKSSKKEFEQEMVRLQESGAVFRSTYPDSDGTQRALIFEQGPSGAGVRREYRILRFELQTRGNTAEQVLETGFAPASAETQKELNRLASEGFAVLALFDTDKFKFTKPSKEREGMISEEFGIMLERKR
ncbi:MAG: hypothetical protein ACJ74T_17985 [Pyrinomonadaceae bacterium]